MYLVPDFILPPLELRDLLKILLATAVLICGSDASHLDFHLIYLRTEHIAAAER